MFPLTYGSPIKCRRCDLLGYSNTIANGPGAAPGNARRRTLAKVSQKSKVKRPAKKRKAPVKAQAHASHEDDHVDSCDIDFNEAEPTADADLPAAKGGVEVVSAKRRR
jgi:hypothetical protein